MGLSASKRVQNALKRSPEFESSCAAVFANCHSLSQRAIDGVRPYQLFSATERLQSILSESLPLVSSGPRTPPDRAQVDRALKTVISRRPAREGEITLDEVEFAVEVLKRLPVGVAGIAGFGVVVKPGKEVVGAAIGAYAVGLVTLDLSWLGCVAVTECD